MPYPCRQAEIIPTRNPYPLFKVANCDFKAEPVAKCDRLQIPLFPITGND
jgi:hypothetical protein